jgi:hypothetical protein
MSFLIPWDWHILQRELVDAIHNGRRNALQHGVVLGKVLQYGSGLPGEALNCCLTFPLKIANRTLNLLTFAAFFCTLILKAID